MRYPLFSICALAGAVFAQSIAQHPPEPLEKARLVAAGLSDQIRSLLSEELKKGSFAGAVEACSSKAQTATRVFAARERVSIRRVSLKYRNPADAPDSWETLRLRELEEQHKNGAMPPEVHEEVTVKGVKSLRYLKPITIQAMCLTCHGSPEQIPADVKKVLNARYREDKATGYKAGDLRGAISVTVPLDAKR
jgi:hypothetical protein